MCVCIFDVSFLVCLVIHLLVCVCVCCCVALCCILSGLCVCPGVCLLVLFVCVGLIVCLGARGLLPCVVFFHVLCSCVLVCCVLLFVIQLIRVVVLDDVSFVWLYMFVVVL